MTEEQQQAEDEDLQATLQLESNVSATDLQVKDAEVKFRIAVDEKDSNHAAINDQINEPQVISQN